MSNAVEVPTVIQPISTSSWIARDTQAGGDEDQGDPRPPEEDARSIRRAPR